MDIRCSECNFEFDLKKTLDIIDYECTGLQFGNKDGTGWLDCICPECGITLTVDFKCVPFAVSKSEYQCELD